MNSEGRKSDYQSVTQKNEKATRVGKKAAKKDRSSSLDSHDADTEDNYNSENGGVADFEKESAESKESSQTHFSAKRRVCLVGSLLLCVFIVFAFAFILPCHHKSCEKDKDCRNNHLRHWTKNFSGMTPLELREFDGGKNSRTNLLVGFSGVSGSPNTSCSGRYCHGILSVNGCNGKSLWRSEIDGTLGKVLCINHSDRKSHCQEGCFVQESKDKIALIDTANGKEKWKANNLGFIRSFKTIRDIDGDGVQDVLLLNGSPKIRTGPSKRTYDTLSENSLHVLSGRSGKSIGTGVPLSGVLHTSERVFLRVHRVSSVLQYILIGIKVASDKTGTLLAIEVQDLTNRVLNSSISRRKMPWGSNKPNEFGFIELFKNSLLLTPPLFSDLNKDGVEDLILCTRNKGVTLQALNGKNAEEIWSRRLTVGGPLDSYSALPAIVSIGSHLINIAVMIELNNQSSRIVVLNSKDGSARWLFTLTNPLFIPPVGVPQTEGIPEGLLLWLPKSKVNTYLRNRKHLTNDGAVEKDRKQYGPRRRRNVDVVEDDKVIDDVVNYLLKMMADNDATKHVVKSSDEKIEHVGDDLKANDDDVSNDDGGGNGADANKDADGNEGGNGADDGDGGNGKDDGGNGAAANKDDDGNEGGNGADDGNGDGGNGAAANKDDDGNEGGNGADDSNGDGGNGKDDGGNGAAANKDDDGNEGGNGADDGNGDGGNGKDDGGNGAAANKDDDGNEGGNGADDSNGDGGNGKDDGGNGTAANKDDDGNEGGNGAAGGNGDGGNGKDDGGNGAAANKVDDGNESGNGVHDGNSADGSNGADANKDADANEGGNGAGGNGPDANKDADANEGGNGAGGNGPDANKDANSNEGGNGAGGNGPDANKDAGGTEGGNGDGGDDDDGYDGTGAAANTNNDGNEGGNGADDDGNDSDGTTVNNVDGFAVSTDDGSYKKPNSNFGDPLNGRKKSRRTSNINFHESEPKPTHRQMSTINQKLFPFTIQPTSVIMPSKHTERTINSEQTRKRNYSALIKFLLDREENFHHEEHKPQTTRPIVLPTIRITKVKNENKEDIQSTVSLRLTSTEIRRATELNKTKREFYTRKQRDKSLLLSCDKRSKDLSKGLSAVLVYRDAKQRRLQMEEITDDGVINLGPYEYKKMFGRPPPTANCQQFIPKIKSKPIVKDIDGDGRLDVIYVLEYMNTIFPSSPDEYRRESFMKIKKLDLLDEILKRKSKFKFSHDVNQNSKRNERFDSPFAQWTAK